MKTKQQELSYQQAKKALRKMRNAKDICILADIHLEASISRLIVYVKKSQGPKVGVLRFVDAVEKFSNFYIGPDFESIEHNYQISALNSMVLKRIYRKALQDPTY